MGGGGDGSCDDGCGGWDGCGRPLQWACAAARRGGAAPSRWVSPLHDGRAPALRTRIPRASRAPSEAEKPGPLGAGDGHGRGGPGSRERKSGRAATGTT